MVGLQRGCGAGDRRVAGGGVGRGISGKTNSIVGEFWGAVSWFRQRGGGTLEVRR